MTDCQLVMRVAKCPLQPPSGIRDLCGYCLLKGSLFMTIEKEYFTQERREANMQVVVKALGEVKELDFNSIVFAFADIIQSSFLNGLTIGKSKEEREEINKHVIELNNKVIDTFNASSQNMMYDMVVLSNLIMEGVENAVQRALADSKEA